MRDALVVLLLAVAAVLAIGCANVANLLLARGAARGDEVAIRAALGAGRVRIARQLLTESVLLSLFGGAGGVVLAYAGVAGLHALTPDLPRLDEVTVDAATLWFALGLSAVTAFVFGLVPAIELVRTPLASMLRQGGRGNTGDHRRAFGRAALLVAEVGLSLMLLLGAGLLLRSFAHMQAVEPGYRVDDVAHFTLSLPASRYPTHEQALTTFAEIERELEAQPGVLGVAGVRGLPLGPGENVTSFTRPDQPPPPPGQGPTAIYLIASPDYFELLGTPMIEGRAFATTDRRGAVPVAIVNRAAAERFWPGEDPVGKQVNVLISAGVPEEGPRTIVGVVADARTRSLVQAPAPEIYLPVDQVAPRTLTFVVRTAGWNRSGAGNRASCRARARSTPAVDLSGLAERAGLGTARASTLLFRAAVAVRGARGRARGGRHLRRRDLRRLSSHARDRSAHGPGRDAWQA